MQAGPPVSDSLNEEHAALDREDAELLRLRVLAPLWLRENPGLVLTALYIGASLVGILFHYLFLRRFGLNVLEFSETSDFLMVVVREPLTVALALLCVPFYIGYGALTVPMGRWARRRFAILRSTPEKRRTNQVRMRPWMPALQISFIVVYAVVFVMFYSQWRAYQVRSGNFKKVTVEFKTDSPMADGALRAEGRALLGTTSRYVFFYDPVAKRSDAVPLDAIARMVWDARSRRERAADAAAKPAVPAAGSPEKSTGKP